MANIPFTLKMDRSNKVTGLTLFLDGKSRPVGADVPFFGKILEALKTHAVDVIRGLLNPKKAIATYSNGAFVLTEDETLLHNGTELNHSIVARVVELARQGIDATPVVLFLENLLQNPSQTSIDELYGFLEACDLPITEDGHFLAYKMIKDDYKDIYTGTMDNSPGAVVEMPRAEVDDNRYRTCSDGLHFAALYYVEDGNYGSSSRGHRLMVVKINPRDVVSIPVDYNNAKGRTCRYTVVQEIEWTDRIRALFARSEAPVDNGVNYAEQSVSEEDFEDEEDEAIDEPADKEDYSSYGRSHGGNLTADDVRSIRVLLTAIAAGTCEMTLTDVGNLYRVHRTQIQRIRDGITHADVV